MRAGEHWHNGAVSVPKASSHPNGDLERHILLGLKVQRVQQVQRGSTVQPSSTLDWEAGSTSQLCKYPLNAFEHVRPLKYQPTDFTEQHKETTTCSVLPVCCVISVICLVSSLSSLELCSILCSSCRLEEPPFRASKDHEMTMLNNQVLFQSTIRKLSQQKLRAAPSLQPEPCRSHRPYLGHSKSFKVTRIQAPQCKKSRDLHVSLLFSCCEMKWNMLRCFQVLTHFVPNWVGNATVHLSCLALKYQL